MLRNFIFLSCFMLMTIPVFADEVTVNMTPAKQFSGITNKSKFSYPSLSVSDMEYEEGMYELDGENVSRPVSARQIVNQDPDAVRKAPMNYSNFPQHYDSSNSMMMMQGGMQGMFNQLGY